MGEVEWAVLETDVGVWMDDTFALQALLGGMGKDSGARGIRLAAAVASCGGSSRVLMKHLRRAGHGDVPVGDGPQCPSLLPSGLSEWGADEDPDRYPGGYSPDGARLLAETIRSIREREGPGGAPVLLLVLGPPSATSEMLRMFPEAAEGTRVVSIMGSIRPGVRLPWGEVSPIAEYNVRLNVPAARAVLAGPWDEPVAMAGVGSTVQMRIEGSAYQRLREGAAARPEGGAALLLEQYEFWLQTCRTNETMRCHAESMRVDSATETPVMFDVGALALEERFPGMMLAMKNLTVSDGGMLRVMLDGSGSPATIAFDWSREEDVMAFKETVVDRIVGSRDRPTSHSGVLTLEVEIVAVEVLILASVLGGLGWWLYCKRRSHRRRYLSFGDAFETPNGGEDRFGE